MNRLGKHICREVFGFMIVCNYVDKISNISLWFGAANQLITGVSGEINPALLVFLQLEMFL